MIGTMLTIAILGYYINNCAAIVNKYPTCKV
jgi:hypothetical protein